MRFEHAQATETVADRTASSDGVRSRADQGEVDRIGGPAAVGGNVPGAGAACEREAQRVDQAARPRLRRGHLSGKFCNPERGGWRVFGGFRAVATRRRSERNDQSSYAVAGGSSQVSERV